MNNAGGNIAKLIENTNNNYYLRVSGMIQDLATYKVEKGKIATSYSPSVEDVNDLIVNESADKFIGENLLDRVDERKDYKINVYNGNYQAAAGYSTLRFVDIKPGTNYVVSKTDGDNGTGITFHDENENYLSWISSKDNDFTFVTPASAYKMAICYDTSCQIKLERGTKSTKFSLSPKDAQLELDNAAGGINLFNTVDCRLLNLQNTSGRAWTDTGFEFTASATSGLEKKVRLLGAFTRNGYYTISAKVRTSQAVNVTLNLTANEISGDFIVSSTPTTISLTTYVSNATLAVQAPTFTVTVGAETIYVDELMIEHGHNASPYAPAPRDLPAKIETAINNITLTADKIKFQNQSGVTFADMFNDPETGNPTLKAGYIDAEKVTTKTLVCVNGAGRIKSAVKREGDGSFRTYYANESGTD